VIPNVQDTGPRLFAFAPMRVRYGQDDNFPQTPGNLLEMLRQLQTLALIVRFQALPVEHLRRFSHSLVDEPTDDLAVFENERDLV